MNKFSRTVIGDVGDNVCQTLCDGSFDRKSGGWALGETDDLLDVLFAGIFLVLGFNGQISEDLDVLLVEAPV